MAEECQIADQLNSLKALLSIKNWEIEELKKELQTFYRNTRYQNYNDNSGEFSPEYVQDENRTDKNSKLCCVCNCQSKFQNVITRLDAETQTFETDFCSEGLMGSTEDWTVPEGTNLTVSDLVREVVDEHYLQTDYVYDENFKMYYSPSTGYYYDMEKRLLYEPYSGTYYKHDSEKNTYEFSHQISISTQENENNDDCAVGMSDKVNELKLDDANNTEIAPLENQIGKKKLKKRRKKRIRSKAIVESKMTIDAKNVKNNISSTDSTDEELKPADYSSLEEGELCSPFSDSSFLDSSDSVSITSSIAVSAIDEGSSEKWPPCIRAIIKESSKLKIGSLLLITCTGGIIGRDKNHFVFIPDVSLSKIHAEIIFDKESWQYSIIDCGSQNGTFVNDMRLSEPKERSGPQVLAHGDHVSLGSCKLLLHIHPGGDTCDDCEPGQIQAGLVPEQDKEVPVFQSKADREKERRQQLRQLKKKFGLTNMNYVDGENALPSKKHGYEDRAQVRRKTKGSQNPYEKNAEPATLDTSLSSTNKGYQMLKKMGWTEGQTLGSNESGILEPIPLVVRQKKAGLGSSPAPSAVREDPRTRKWRKAQKRYHQIDETTPRTPMDSTPPP